MPTSHTDPAISHEVMAWSRQWSGTRRADQKPAGSSGLQGGCRHLYQGDAEPQKGFGQDRSREFRNLE